MSFKRYNAWMFSVLVCKTFGNVRMEREGRHVESVVRRIDRMKGSQITRGKGRSRKSIREAIKEDLEISELDRNMVYDGI